MKPEELIQSLDYVGEDLLVESEQSVRISRKRPWMGAAAAAVLALAVGIGGFVLLKNNARLARKNPTDGSTASTVQMTDITDPADPKAAKLTVGDNYKGISARSFPDLETSLAANPWQAVSEVPAPDRMLPVYENLAWHREMPIPAYYDAAALTQKLEAAAGILGLELRKAPVVNYWKPSDAEESNGIPYQCQAGTDQPISGGPARIRSRWRVRWVCRRSRGPWPSGRPPFRPGRSTCSPCCRCRTTALRPRAI